MKAIVMTPPRFFGFKYASYFSLTLQKMKALASLATKNAIKLMQEGKYIRQTAQALNISLVAVGRIHFDKNNNILSNMGGSLKKISVKTVEYPKINLKHSVSR